MQNARRIYLYLISYISLLMVLGGVSTLLRLLIEAALGATRGGGAGFNDAAYQREQFSFGAAVLLVGGIVWAIHWLLVQRSVAPTQPAAAEERQSGLRRFFLYAVLATTLWNVAFAGQQLLFLGLRAPPTAAPSATLPFSGSAALVGLLVYGLAGAYYWRVLRQDLAATPETATGATLHRLYSYLVCYVTLTVVLVQTATLARLLWEALTAGTPPWARDAQWVPAGVASPISWLVVAGTIWLLHWRAVQRETAAAAAELRSAVRKFYLYGMTLQTVVVTLVSASFFLNSLFRLLWGSDPVAGTGDSLLSAAGGPVLTALVYGVFWAYHWQVLKWDTGFAGAGAEFNAGIRRLYHYLVALIGLGMLAGGVGNLLRLLIDGLLGGRDTIALNPQGWGDQISFVVTLILVGTPVWLAHWLPMQREALAPDGEAARQGLARRLYLFLILLLTMLGLLSGSAWLIYQVFRHLGEPFPPWASDISWALATTVTAGVLLAYHLTTLLGDLRARRAAPPVEVAAPAPLEVASLVLLRSPDAARLDQALARLSSALPTGSQMEVMPAPGVSRDELQAWLAGRVAAPVPPLLPPEPEPPVPSPVAP